MARHLTEGIIVSIVSRAPTSERPQKKGFGALPSQQDQSSQRLKSKYISTSKNAIAIPSSAIPQQTHVQVCSLRRYFRLRSTGTDRTARPRVAFRISAALKLDFIRRIVHGSRLLRGENGVPGEDLVLVLDVVGVAIRHEHIVAAIGLCACERIAVLVVLETPSDCVVVAAACV